ncbi:MAG TPA: hypothetical protein VKR55_29795 [Bradyrhizobium sp.]|uniref:hypothetical protein n=1 Tax=Bradyrhizobium sp. TaxID=376 RepID=UPI002CDF92AC|nr:hypothetical protein [Bradyrhizobium sp.]HLZ06333.1 hypothetical protein [Bradyrhizobium sp.]
MGEKTISSIARMVALSLVIASGTYVASASAQSLTDKLKSFFGGGSKSNDQPPPPVVDPSEAQPDMDCPQVTIRAGASTYAVAAPGKQPIGDDVRFQASITKMARDCTKLGGEITARIGIQGRVIVGPAGAPATVEVPLRVAVVQGGIGEKVIATKAYRTTVNVGEEESVPFTLVADDLVYPVPPANVADNYIFYVGFDPQLVSAERPKPVRKKR